MSYLLFYQLIFDYISFYTFISGLPSVIQTCNATKKAGGQARKQGKNRKGKRRGAKKLDSNSFVIMSLNILQYLIMGVFFHQQEAFGCL